MTRLESILHDAKSLSDDDRQRLVEALKRELTLAAPDDEHAAAQRGLDEWTKSVGGEDWSAYYPDSLTNGRSHQA